MSVTPDRGERLLRLVALRVRRAQARMLACRAEREAAAQTLEAARAMLAGWDRCLDELDTWLRASTPAQHARWASMAQVRRTDLARARHQAVDYLRWCDAELQRSRGQEATANAAWRREQARHDALERRLGDMRRHQVHRTEEIGFQEQADAGEALRARGVGR